MKIDIFLYENQFWQQIYLFNVSAVCTFWDVRYSQCVIKVLLFYLFEIILLCSGTKFVSFRASTGRPHVQKSSKRSFIFFYF